MPRRRDFLSHLSTGSFYFLERSVLRWHCSINLCLPDARMKAARQRRGAGPSNPAEGWAGGEGCWIGLPFEAQGSCVPQPAETQVTFTRASRSENWINCYPQATRCLALNEELSRDIVKPSFFLVMRGSYGVAEGKDEIDLQFNQKVLATSEDLPNEIICFCLLLVQPWSRSDPGAQGHSTEKHPSRLWAILDY